MGKEKISHLAKYLLRVSWKNHIFLHFCVSVFPKNNLKSFPDNNDFHLNQICGCYFPLKTQFISSFSLLTQAVYMEGVTCPLWKRGFVMLAWAALVVSPGSSDS